MFIHNFTQIYPCETNTHISIYIIHTHIYWAKKQLVSAKGILRRLTYRKKQYSFGNREKYIYKMKSGEQRLKKSSKFGALSRVNRNHGMEGSNERSIRVGSKRSRKKEI